MRISVTRLFGRLWQQLLCFARGGGAAIAEDDDDYKLDKGIRPALPFPALHNLPAPRGIEQP